ncbi:hypothetical protein G7Y89_g13270 [Cudoniella acicularis]|uniref:Peptidase A1 domain-containing protein n=1 Tax=Cudoniella acicularis TaxID=354080 RepID=A0A8H4VWL0_9HELO|nr:hypothetical protein G7Y89_g13270 [Cudoniella acicularis]
MKLPHTLLAAIALASGCASSALDGNVQNNSVEALLVPRSAMTVEIPFYTIYNNGLWMFTNVTIGTPGQLVVLLILTYWGDSQLSNGSEVNYGPSFSPHESSTFSILPDTRFNTTETADEWYSGEYAQDTMHVNGNVFADFTFAFIEEGVEVGDDFLGLGDKVDEAAVQNEGSTTENTLLTYAVSKDLIQTTAFSISFDDPLDQLPTGNILLGGLDAGKINGSLETLDTTIVRGTDTWYDTVLAVSLEAVSFSPNGDLSHQKPLEPFQAIQVHPASGPMWLPPSVATTVWAALGASYDTTVEPEQAVPVVPCSYLSNSTTLDLHLGTNTIIQVPMSDLTIHNGTGLNGDVGEYAEGCKLDIAAIATNVSFNSVGSMALKHMYTVFDLQNNEISIGLRSSSAAASTNIMVIGQAGVPALNLNSSSPSPTATSKSSSSPSPGPKKSNALAIGLGVGISLGFILFVGITAGSIFLRRRRAAPAPAPFINSSGQQPQYSQYPGVASIIPEKAPLSVLTDAVSPPVGQGPQYQSQHVSPSSGLETPHERTGASIRYSELSGISAFHAPHNPEQNPLYSPPHSPPLGP